MRDRFSLRNIPEEAEQLAEAIHRQTHLSESDVCRLALVSGMLVEVAGLPPEPDGTIGGLQVTYLAKALRRVLGSAIDLLWEHGEHPYQALIGGNKGGVAFPSSGEVTLTSRTVLKETPSEHSMGDNLDLLGIGAGLSETWENNE